MKILIVGFAKIKFMPYINFYLDSINKDKNEVHVIYWNRDCKEEDLSKYEYCKFYEFKSFQKYSIRFLKICNFLKFRRFASNIIKSNKFDFIIVLHTMPGILLLPQLVKSYRNRFIFDYRDSTYEYFYPFKKLIWKLVNNSYATFVSSNGFKKFMPQNCDDKINISHNILIDSLKHRDEKAKYGVKSNKIRIAFWGFIRHEELNKKIIYKLSNDLRFELHYYGPEQQTVGNLKEYAKEISAKNIFFHGEYAPEDRYVFVRSTDIIHNLYFDNNMMLAMGNKFYDGIIFRLPQLCMPESFMGEVITEYGVGLTCDPNDKEFTNKIYEYYSMINYQEFSRSCDKLLDKVIAEYNKASKVLRIFNVEDSMVR